MTIITNRLQKKYLLTAILLIFNCQVHAFSHSLLAWPKIAANGREKFHLPIAKGTGFSSTPFYSNLISLHSTTSHQEAEGHDSSSSRHHQNIKLNTLAIDWGSAEFFLNDANKYTILVNHILVTIVITAAYIILAMCSAWVAGVPNMGLGDGFHLDPAVLLGGSLLSLPLVFLGWFEGNYGLFDIEQRRSYVFSRYGHIFESTGVAVAILTSILLGIGEEWLFRGSFQTGIQMQVSNEAFAVFLASMILALGRSFFMQVYLGVLLWWSGNLALPIVAHAIFLVAAALEDYWTVSQLSDEAKEQLVTRFTDQVQQMSKKVSPFLPMELVDEGQFD